jgi:uncharacterized membrane protein
VQLLYLVLILIAPYVVLTVAASIHPALASTPRQRARVALTIFFAFTGIGHFIATDALVSMIPPAVPYRAELVYLTGILEVLGAIAIWIPRWRKLTGVLLILMLIAFLPVNIYAAMQRIDFGGHELGPAYLLARIPVQLLLIAVTYFATVPGQQHPHSMLDSRP